MITFIINIFEIEFNSLQMNFNDDRKLILLTRENEKCKEDDYFFACIDYNKNEILICYDEDNLIEFIKQTEEKITKFKPLFKFFSRHEYGHTTIAPNMLELKNLNINRNFYHKLRNFDVNLYQKSFRELYADLFASKIKNTIPKVYLNYKINVIKNKYLENLEEHKKNFPDLCNFILSLIEFVNSFYAFKKWKCLIKLFKENNETELLGVINSICVIYERIIEEYDDYDSKMKNLLDNSDEIENEIMRLFTRYNYKMDSDSWY